MAAVGSDDEFGFGPGAVEGPGAFHGANDVVTALHDHSGDVADARGVAPPRTAQGEVVVLGAFQASPAVRRALSDRIR